MGEGEGESRGGREMGRERDGEGERGGRERVGKGKRWGGRERGEGERGGGRERAREREGKKPAENTNKTFTIQHGLSLQSLINTNNKIKHKLKMPNIISVSA